MAEVAVLTTVPEERQRIRPGYKIVEIDFATTGATVVTIAPVDGKLIEAQFTAGMAIDATNNYASVACLNKSNSDAAMFGTNDLGDGTDTAQYGIRDMVLSTTAANLDVTKGDWLEVTHTVQGTLTAASKVIMIYEVTGG